MSRPTRGTTAGTVYLDLQNQARRTHRPTQELLQLYVLEGFLARLAASEIRERFVLKGGVLLAAFDTRRATAELPFHVDVNVGDPIWPAPTTISLPRLRGGTPIELSGYPMPMVHAEKIVTAIQRGVANTRWRDFGDIWTLSRRQPIAADELRKAIGAVAHHRNAELVLLADALDGYANLAQGAWAQWRRRDELRAPRRSRERSRAHP